MDLLVKTLGASPSDRVLEHILEVLPEIEPSASAAVPVVEELAAKQDDHFLRYEAAQALLKLRSPAGFGVLASLLAAEPPLFVQQNAGKLVDAMTGLSFAIGVGTAEERARARIRFQDWYVQNGARVRWRQDRKRFE